MSLAIAPFGGAPVFGTGGGSPVRSKFAESVPPFGTSKVSGASLPYFRGTFSGTSTFAGLLARAQEAGILQEASTQAHASLTIAATQRCLVEDLPGCMTEFERRCPHVGLVLKELAFGEVGAAMEAGEADLGFAARSIDHGSSWLSYESCYELDVTLVTPGITVRVIQDTRVISHIGWSVPGDLFGKACRDRGDYDSTPWHLLPCRPALAQPFQHGSEQVEERLQPLDVLDHPDALEMKLVHVLGEPGTEPPLAVLHLQADLRTKTGVGYGGLSAFSAGDSRRDYFRVRWEGVTSLDPRHLLPCRPDPAQPFSAAANRSKSAFNRSTSLITPTLWK